MMKTEKDRISDRFPLQTPPPSRSAFDHAPTHMEISLDYTKNGRGRGYVLRSCPMHVGERMISVTINVGMLSSPSVMVAATTRFNARAFKALCDQFVPHFQTFAQLAEAGDREAFKQLAARVVAGEPVQPRIPEPAREIALLADDGQTVTTFCVGPACRETAEKQCKAGTDPQGQTRDQMRQRLGGLLEIRCARCNALVIDRE